MKVTTTFYLCLQHIGVPGDRMDHAAEVVVAERRLDLDLVMDLDLALDHLVSQLAVIMAHVVTVMVDVYVFSNCHVFEPFFFFFFLIFST